MVVSVVISTFNRCDTLRAAIASVLNQECEAPCFELIVVDNNSSDNTAHVIQSFAASDPRVHYVLERRQGLAYGRNTGAAVATGEFILYTDDDVVVSTTWVRDFYHAFLRYPEADFIGGKVLPVWKRKPEKWLDSQMAPLALQNLGEKPVKVSLQCQHCLIGACLGVRRSAFDKAGLFDPTTQRVGDGIGSMEDSEWELRVLEKGGWGIYVPEIVCTTEISAERMTKAYHRKWYLGHGKFHALSRRPEYEGGAFRLLNVPAFVYRQLLESGLHYFTCLLRGRFHEAFTYETRVLFHFGFIRHRWLS